MASLTLSPVGLSVGRGEAAVCVYRGGSSQIVASDTGACTPNIQSRPCDPLSLT